MSTDTFGQRFNRWRGSTKKLPVIAPPPPLYETIASHANPLGMFAWSMRAHPHSMPVGVDRHHRMIYSKSETAIGTVGPARSVGGKSASFAVPILMEHGGPAVAMSLRTDVLNATAAMRSLRGVIYMFDPDGLGIPEGVEEIRWSLVVGAENLDVALTTCRQMVHAANVIQSSARNAADNAHFAELAGTLLGVLCHYAAVMGLSFRWVYDLVTLGDYKKLGDILNLIAQWEDKRPYRMLAGVLNGPGDRELGSILTTLNVAMAAYQTESALRTTDNPNLNPAAFVRASLEEENPWLWTSDPSVPGRGTGNTLFLIRGNKPIAAAINVGIVTQLIEARYQLYRDDEKAGNAETHPDLLCCLDEMANMPIPQLPEYLAAPGRGVLLTGMLQDFSQLSKWGDQGPSMLTQLQQLVIYRGERVADTLRLIESLCPTQPIDRITSSGRGEGSMLGASASPERLPGIPTSQIYSGINDDPTVVLYLGADGEPPQWIHIRPYYSDPMYLNAQVKSLWQMAERLDRNDPRRLLPLPNLDRDHSGRALMAAGGEDLLFMYREAVRHLGKPNDTQEVTYR